MGITLIHNSFKQPGPARPGPAPTSRPGTACSSAKAGLPRIVSDVAQSSEATAGANCSLIHRFNGDQPAALWMDGFLFDDLPTALLFTTMLWADPRRGNEPATREFFMLAVG
ncbi:hypothetical protein MBM_01560 [Drepanopeziza brunnea f. sp. 'multigermtubi' MB_m1]|uniref:Uncharacterized protein n=1 Tax=Marssonina brunnea f. sp. multigermtubi (strain MB_m1) TaxID=1072389 RepID=K1XJL0_MARBU|nr:uncharacterized protein MBM_01560 [Drepanopeziza brunnea f. sp. 'multigermtubi' MB_m1]EKD20878.1 hypothetical protein MBM_01560 [Drepanopeziza brunnea f. sp. 'multigermtubi' MB_m1]